LSFSYVTPENVFDLYKASEKYMRPLFEPLTEFERLARNRPHPGIDKNYPKVTDGTLASIIAKTPRRIVQQVPTCKVKSDEDDWLDIMAQWIIDNEIIPNANSQYELIQKCWALIEKGLTYGSQFSLTAFQLVLGKPRVDFTLPYIKDGFIEAGKISGTDANAIAVRAWYQETDLDAIIDKQTKAEAAGLDAGWNLTVLREIKGKLSQKDDLSTTPDEKDKQNRRGGVELVHVFQNGVGAKFYTIHMKTKQIARTKVNKDPRGVMPINYFYAGTDMSNPLGRGFAEQVGAMQNLLDAEVQMYQYNRALMLNPPMTKKGNWNKAQAKLAPNVLVDLGSDPNAEWAPVQIDSTSLSSFPANYGLMKSQILNLLSSPDTSISAEVGNPGFSKTDSGVKNQQAILSIDDNYIRKNFEAWWEREVETLVNLYFAERTDIGEFVVDDATAAKLKAIDPEHVGEGNKVRIDFKSETSRLSVTVDASSSNMKDNQAQMDILDGLLERYEKAPTLQQLIPPEKIKAVWNSLVTASGVENPEELTVEDELDEQGKPVEKPQQQSMQPEMVQQMIDQAIQQNDANDPNKDPMLATIKAFGMKWSDIPEDSKHKVLDHIGLSSQEASVPQLDLEIQSASAQHDILSSIEAQGNTEAQMAQTDAQNQAQNELALKGQSQAAESETPTETSQQPTETPDHPLLDDSAFAAQLTSLGLNENQIQQAIALTNTGKYSDAEVMQMMGLGEGAVA
jgi:hypothetical protein